MNSKTSNYHIFGRKRRREVAFSFPRSVFIHELQEQGHFRKRRITEMGSRDGWKHKNYWAIKDILTSTCTGRKRLYFTYLTCGMLSPLVCDHVCRHRNWSAKAAAKGHFLFCCSSAVHCLRNSSDNLCLFSSFMSETSRGLVVLFSLYVSYWYFRQ